MKFVDLHNHDGIITDAAGKIYSKDEAEALRQAPNTFFTMHKHSKLPIANREEDVDITPYKFSYQRK